MTRTLIAALVLACSPAFGQTPQYCTPHHDDPSYCERKQMQAELRAIQERLDGRFVLIVGYQTSYGWHDVPPAASMARAEDHYATSDQCRAAGEAKVAGLQGQAKFRCERMR